LELLVRRNLPTGVRHLLRVGKHLLRRGEGSPSLPAHLIEDCRFSASRYDLVAALPSAGRIAEVGTFKGDFAHHILLTCNPRELHLVDLDFSLLDPAVAKDARVRAHAGHSHAVLAAFPDEYFDWIYIDADHSYAGTSRDAAAAAAKVKAGGYLVFNDFAHSDPYLGAYGVHRAVVDFALKQNWPFAWFAYDGNALYDVALKRPLPAAPA
jgi:predicted O-methyltransferase YrrM